MQQVQLSSSYLNYAGVDQTNTHINIQSTKHCERSWLESAVRTFCLLRRNLPSRRLGVLLIFPDEVPPYLLSRCESGSYRDAVAPHLIGLLRPVSGLSTFTTQPKPRFSAGASTPHGNTPWLPSSRIRAPTITVSYIQTKVQPERSDKEDLLYHGASTRRYRHLQDGRRRRSVWRPWL
jgi:hypothetical protein